MTQNDTKLKNFLKIDSNNAYNQQIFNTIG